MMYPFDIQTCNLTFMIANAPGKRKLEKETEGWGVPYLNAVSYRQLI